MIYAIPFPDISPDIFSIMLPIFGGVELALKWYAMAYILGLFAAAYILRNLIRRPALWPQNAVVITPKQLEDFITWAIVGVILGGRLGFVVFYQPSYYLANPQDIIKIWQGGMSFHGGFAGVCAAVFLFARKYKIYLLSFADAVAIATPPALLMGRLANFINAELWGRETDMPWGVIFPGDYAQTCVNAAYGLCARHPSQIYEALGEGLILGAVLLYFSFRGKILHHAGLGMGVFFMGYGAVRFLVELVRQPDAQFQSPINPIGYALQFGGFGGLTMGQILSLPMIILGAILIARVWRKS